MDDQDAPLHQTSIQLNGMACLQCTRAVLHGWSFDVALLNISPQARLELLAGHAALPRSRTGETALTPSLPAFDLELERARIVCVFCSFISTTRFPLPPRSTTCVLMSKAASAMAVCVWSTVCREARRLGVVKLVNRTCLDFTVSLASVPSASKDWG